MAPDPWRDRIACVFSGLVALVCGTAAAAVSAAGHDTPTGLVTICVCAVTHLAALSPSVLSQRER